MTNILKTFLLFHTAFSAVLNVDDFGAKRGDKTAAVKNTAAINATLAALKPGDTLRFLAGEPYHVTVGIAASGLHNVTISLEGQLIFSNDFSLYPLSVGWARNMFDISSSSFVTVTGGGSLDGQGQIWWDKLILGEEPVRSIGRPHMMVFYNCTDMILERLTLINSPQFHVQFETSARVTIRYIRVTVDRKKQRSLKSILKARRLSDAGHGELSKPLAEYIVNQLVGTGGTWKDWLLDDAVKLLPHWLLQPEDLNTDGIDFFGRDYHIHDCDIDNDDDSICAKPVDGGDKTGLATCTENVLIENSVMKGFGATIGSVPPRDSLDCVRNVTFRNISMPKTGRGIYIKSNPGCDGTKTAIIENILYEDITIEQPWYWGIWIGPQQMHEPGSKFTDMCPLTYPLHTPCPTSGCVTFKDITLRRVKVHDPLLSPGVILGNSTNPMKNIIFDDTTVTYSRLSTRGFLPFGRNYVCQDAQVTVLGSSTPLPDCKSLLNEMVI